MSANTSSMHNAPYPVLNRHNYFQWERAAVIVLQREEVYDIVTGAYACPEADKDGFTARDVRTWHNAHSKAKGVMATMVPADLWAPCRDLPADHAWRKLRTLTAQSMYDQAMLFAQLFRTEMAPGSRVEDHLQHLSDIAAQLKALKKPVDDETLVFATLSSLPLADFEPLLAAIEAQSVPIEFEDSAPSGSKTTTKSKSTTEDSGAAAAVIRTPATTLTFADLSFKLVHFQERRRTTLAHQPQPAAFSARTTYAKPGDKPSVPYCKKCHNRHATAAPCQPRKPRNRKFAQAKASKANAASAPQAFAWKARVVPGPSAGTLPPSADIAADELTTLFDVAMPEWELVPPSEADVITDHLPKRRRRAGSSRRIFVDHNGQLVTRSSVLSSRFRNLATSLAPASAAGCDGDSLPMRSRDDATELAPVALASAAQVCDGASCMPVHSIPRFSSEDEQCTAHALSAKSQPVSVPPKAAGNNDSSRGWYLDSGASRHMTPNREFFSRYTSLCPANAVSVATAQGLIPAVGRGDVRVTTYVNGHRHDGILRDVLHVPQCTDNLVSLSQLEDLGFHILFSSGKPASISSNGTPYAEAVKINGMYELCMTTHLASSGSAYLARAQPPHQLSLRLWHQRLGHINLADVTRTLRSHAWQDVSGTPLNDMTNDCPTCLLTKTNRISLPKTGRDRANRVAETLHVDIKGPFETVARQGERYNLVILDEYSHFEGGRPIKAKSDAGQALQDFVSYLENQSGHRVRRIICDNAKEFLHGSFGTFCRNRGIAIQPSPPYRPELNGRAERRHRTLSDSANSLLHQAKLPKTFWADAYRFAIFNWNRVITHNQPDQKSPFELVHKRKPRMANCRTFGSVAYVAIPHAKRKALNPRAIKCILLGYMPHAYTFFHPPTGEIVNSIDAKFVEDSYLTPGELDVSAPGFSSPMRVHWSPAPPTLIPPRRRSNDDLDHVPAKPAPTAAPQSDALSDLDLESFFQQPPHEELVAPVIPSVPTASEQEEHSTAIAPPTTPHRPAATGVPLSPDTPRINRVGLLNRPTLAPLPASITLRPHQRTRSGRLIRLPQRYRDSDSSEEDPFSTDTTAFALKAQELRSLQRIDAFRNAAALQAQVCVELDDKGLTYHDAINSPDSDKWLAAMKEEYQSLLDNQTWTLVDLPKGRKPIRNKWVYKVKRNADGSIERFKARLVAKGFTQREGVDYQEVFAPVMRHDSFRMFIAIATKLKSFVRQVDAVTAYLNGHIDEDIYMAQPQGFTVSGQEQKVCKLLRGLYGLKQSAHVWNLHSMRPLIQLGFTRSKVDPCVFYRGSGDKLELIAQYVDDFLIAAPTMKRIETITKVLNEHYKTKHVSDGPTYFVIGNEVHYDRDKQKSTLSQRKYINEKLKEFGLDNAKSVPDPMTSSTELTKLMCPSTAAEKQEMDNIPYRAAVGSLIHAGVNTRFDIAAPLSVVTRYFSNPGPQHWLAVKRIFRYLKGTADHAIVYDGTMLFEIQGYMDASYASCADDRKSTTGYIFTLLGGAIAWGSKKQQTVAASTAEAEYMAAYEGTIQAIWIRNFLLELGLISDDDPIHLFEDNRACIRLAENPEHISRAKHVDVKYHFVRERVSLGHIAITYLPTAEMLADMLTKPLCGSRFRDLRTSAGLLPTRM